LAGAGWPAVRVVSDLADRVCSNLPVTASTRREIVAVTGVRRFSRRFSAEIAAWRRFQHRDAAFDA
jgi:hypothetical protein